MHFIWVWMYFSTEVLIGVTISTSPTWDQTSTLCPCKSLAICRAKVVLRILSYFKTLSIDQVLGIELRPPAPQSSALLTELVLLQLRSQYAQENLYTTLKWSFIYTRTSIDPPVCILIGLRTFLCTMKFGRRATGGTSHIMATLALHYQQKKKAYSNYMNITTNSF